MKRGKEGERRGKGGGKEGGRRTRKRNRKRRRRRKRYRPQQASSAPDTLPITWWSFVKPSLSSTPPTLLLLAFLLVLFLDQISVKSILLPYHFAAPYNHKTKKEVEHSQTKNKLFKNTFIDVYIDRLSSLFIFFSSVIRVMHLFFMIKVLARKVRESWRTYHNRRCVCIHEGRVHALQWQEYSATPLWSSR